MIIFVCLLALFDALMLPIKGYLSAGIFGVIAVAGWWRKDDYKGWFTLALIFISLATAMYLLAGQSFSQTIIHKLSDWSLFFLIIGVVQLARFSKNRS